MIQGVFMLSGELSFTELSLWLTPLIRVTLVGVTDALHMNRRIWIDLFGLLDGFVLRWRYSTGTL